MSTANATNATIKTATVALRTIMVDNRQLSLATFRQLSSMRYVDELFTPSGPTFDSIWGWVNYFWQDSHGDKHFVFQRGSALVRFPHTINFMSKRCDIGEPWRFPCWGRNLRSNISSSLSLDETYALWTKIHDSCEHCTAHRLHVVEQANWICGVNQMIRKYRNEIDAAPQLFIAT